MKKIIVLGDSHVRSFAKNKYFLPLFVGPGKTTCFINDKTSKETKNKVIDILSKFEKDDRILLVFGEPDCRWWSGQGWHPWNSKEKPSLNENGLNTSINRFKNFIETILNKGYSNIVVYNTTPSEREVQNSAVKIWNMDIENFCFGKTIPFINLNEELFNEGMIKTEYLADPIHLNEKSVNLTLKIFNNMDIIQYDGSTVDNYYYGDVKSKFKFNSKFNCLTYD